MHELDRIASRYKELRGKPVTKKPAALLSRLEAYAEILDDLVDMREQKENPKERKRVWRKAKRIERQLGDQCRTCGLELSEELARATKTKQAGAPRNYVPSDADAAPPIRLADDTNAS